MAEPVSTGDAALIMCGLSLESDNLENRITFPSRRRLFSLLVFGGAQLAVTEGKGLGVTEPKLVSFGREW